MFMEIVIVLYQKKYSLMKLWRNLILGVLAYSTLVHAMSRYGQRARKLIVRAVILFYLTKYLTKKLEICRKKVKSFHLLLPL